MSDQNEPQQLYPAAKSSKSPPRPPKPAAFSANLNSDPPETDGAAPSTCQHHHTSPVFSLLPPYPKSSDGQSAVNESIEAEGKRLSKLGKSRSRNCKVDCAMDDGADAADGYLPGQGISSSREEKVSSLKTGLVHVARRMPKNAHAHFILGLMYQRLGQPSKAVLAYEKAEEILLRPDAEIDRRELLSLVQIHHAQCLMLETLGDGSFDKELEPQELDEINSKLKESMQSDVRQAALWNTLGLILLKTGRLQSAIAVLSSLLAVAPDNYDCLGNLGIAYLQNGNLELSEKCFQELILKDQNHPAALINYAALLLCRYGSVVAGAGANAGEGASADHTSAVNVAKECLFASLKEDPKAAHVWANLANAYYMTGDHRNSSKCLEKAAKLEVNCCMSTRYAVAVHRIKDAERFQDPSDQISLAGNEMASIIRDGDSVSVELPIAWAGLAMVHKAQHEIASAFEAEQNTLMEVEEHADYSLKQAVAEDPDDAVQWHQLGLHSLCTRQFKNSQKYLKAAVARFKECSYAWSNLGISLQLSDEPSQAEEVYKRALELATTKHAHTIFSNLGNLYRQQKHHERAKAMFTKSLELQPGYAPAFNNLGLVFVAEGQWEEAKFCFDKALRADPLLDAAKSNMLKAVSASSSSAGLSSSLLQD
ncbi:probable UDP-N-acetylglucosamine--peptide N-acetylglucosaminyltransferase SPINDLY [Pyrus x bretschneideri]|uniref:probable UDP-N-acetylglucosamine--peptide N-acetylglucosaminyltransferase SPINDLY n=1 Tax=Pyrus x bretschneideri TaxID=225117 RepID=UPI00051186B4|nr:probable UDP-N-acetylglucosamine--peptide N-acetylglucosaminyltransferase SPINDLY [Pyrus x bretschneideri]